MVILKKVRDNMKFDDRDAVKKQIAKDIKKAKQDLLVVVTFGTFDGVHPGHEYYLSEAKKYGDRLITIIGTDKNVAKIKGRPPKKSQFERMSKVLQLGLSDGVIIGDEEDPFKFIGFYQPWVIALGYDQAGFAEHLEEYLEHQKLDTQILRIEPYKPEKYKSSLIN
ncbi:MAG: adenylyltransferase/cytidyltransferase family protein [Candidatus Peribacteria bacterium]|nr:MAG: adenylyltransferase/cytidyltransferase family protein [Candidatus Peribacteria bacterium]